jgi:hypothetical protein
VSARSNVVVIGVGAVVLLLIGVGGGVLLTRGRQLGGSEQRDLTRALAALERQERALDRLEQRRDVGPSTIVVTAPSTRESPDPLATAMPAAAEPAPAPAEPSREQLDSEVSARAIVERAIAGGSWGDREVSSFREQFAKLTRAQQASVLQSISQAINEGRFHPDPSRLPI